MLAATQAAVKPDVYGRKALVTRTRRAASKRAWLAQYEQRRAEAQARIEAVAAKATDKRNLDNANRNEEI